MFKFIKLALSSPKRPESPNSDILPERMDEIVGAWARGNVRLQEGLFYTRKDVDEQFQRIKGFDFLS
ncbi:MAG: hypothetical protein Pars2KO_10060 [Parasphingorhabdus sp.]